MRRGQGQERKRRLHPLPDGRPGQDQKADHPGTSQGGVRRHFEAEARPITEPGDQVANHVELLMSPDLGVLVAEIGLGHPATSQAVRSGHPVGDTRRDHHANTFGASRHRPARPSVHLSENTKSMSRRNITHAEDTA